MGLAGRVRSPNWLRRTAVLLHFTAQTIDLIAQRQQAAKHGQYAKHGTNGKKHQQQHNQWQIDFLPRQVMEHHGLGVGDRQQNESQQDDDFNQGVNDVHGISPKQHNGQTESIYPGVTREKAAWMPLVRYKP